MRYVVGVLVVTLMFVGKAMLMAQQPAQTCKDMPTRCDKELLLLRGEVDNKRQAIAVLLDANEQWQARAEKAEARLEKLQRATIPNIPAPTTSDPTPPKD